jgi:hypothetical protein
MERNNPINKNDMKITEKIKTYEDALKETGRPDVPDMSAFPEDMRKHFTALYKMVVIVEALNEGWKPDWNNTAERKCFPWFWMSPSSFAFYDSFYVNGDAYAGSGSRLKLKSYELADYCGKQFVDIWKDIQLG